MTIQPMRIRSTGAVNRPNHSFSASAAYMAEDAGPSLRSDGMKSGLPYRYVLEAQIFHPRKVRHADPRRSRSTSAILLFDSRRCKRKDVEAVSGGERGSGVAGVVAAGACAPPGGGGGERVLAGVRTSGRPGGREAGDGAPAADEGDRERAAEERQGRFRDAGASVAGRPAAGGLDGEPAHPADAAFDQAADHPGPAAGQGQEPAAGGVASGGFSEAGVGCVRQEGPCVADRTGAEPGGAGGGRGLAEGGRSDGRRDRGGGGGAEEDGQGGWARAVAADGAGDRGLFGDGDPGRSGRD